ncbi:MAG: hypothetical protein WCW31_06070, partial [Patescibacteria group bacterium]
MNKLFNKIANVWKRMPHWSALLIVLILGVGVGVGIFYGVWNYKLKSRYQLPTPVAQDNNQPPSQVVVPTSTNDVLGQTSTTQDYLSGPLPFVQKPDNTKLTLDMEWAAKPEFWGIKKALTSVVEAYKDKVSQGDYYKLTEWLDNQNMSESEYGDSKTGTWLLGKVKSGKYMGSALFIRHEGNQSYADTYYRFLVSVDGKQVRLLDLLYTEPGLGDPYDVSTPEERLLFIEAYNLTWPKLKEGNYETSNGKAVEIQESDYKWNNADLLIDWLKHGSETVAPVIGTLKDGRRVYGEPNSPRAYVIDNGGETLNVTSVIPEKSGHLAVTWNTRSLSGRTLGKDYIVPPGGCGSNIWPGTPSDSENFSAENLVSIGTTSEGDQVYILKEMTKSPTVKQVYDWWYMADQSSKPSLEVFTAKYIPIIFWKDAFGRWVYYLDEQFMPAVECGKPVIYLYPTKTTNVSVKLPSFINVTVSDPAYPLRGWNVVAHPDGSLGYADGKTYGSLYWEGTGVNYQSPREGFVVKDGEQESFLKSTLTKYGLNQKESQEFMDFWLPQMKG